MTVTERILINHYNVLASKYSTFLPVVVLNKKEGYKILFWLTRKSKRNSLF